MQQYGRRINFFASSWAVEVQPGRAILEKPSAGTRYGGAYLLSFDGGRPPQPRWGVVQPVGHHTVNVDGEGSNPSAPANFPFRNDSSGAVGFGAGVLATTHRTSDALLTAARPKGSRDTR